jgi:hypothetical protein
MADQKIVAVRSNVDRLNAEAVHHLYEDMVGRSAHAGEDWMRLVVPKGLTLGMERAISTEGPHDDGAEITAAVGIPPIPNDRGSADYPQFVADGTGLFDPHGPHMIHPIFSTAMKFEGRDGRKVFASSTRGQEPSSFLLNTFEEITQVALPVEGARFKERVQHLYMEPDHE